MEVKLYVGNLSDTTTEQELRRLFAQAGQVTSVSLIQDRQSGQARLFAYVVMGSQAEAQTAISMFNAYSLADRALIVKTVRAREAQGRDSSRLSAFAPPSRKGMARQPKTPGSGYQSRLGAFGGGSPLQGPRRRGGGKAN